MPNETESAVNADAAPSDVTPPLTLTQADDGKTTTVADGEIVAIALPATLSAGYGWTLAESDGVAQQGEPEVSKPSGGGAGHAVGGAQTQTFRLKITGTGEHVATFNYGRPWEQAAPSETATFTFDVR